MVRNPPGYFLMTGRPAIVVPYADSETILAVARRYAARYVVIEPAGAAGPIGQLYDARGADGLQMLGELEGTRVFLVSP
jgi:hypothetical protein